MNAKEANGIWMYDATTGIITYRSRPGVIATTRNGNGYLLLRNKGQAFKAHRIAWLLHWGEIPDRDIDHINGDRTDNRIVNLRSVSRSVNMRNARKPSNNTSGVTGVYWDKSKDCWRSLIKVHGKSFNLGHFKQFDDAVSARKAAEAHHGFHENHGRN